MIITIRVEGKRGEGKSRVLDALQSRLKDIPGLKLRVLPRGENFTKTAEIRSYIVEIIE